MIGIGHSIIGSSSAATSEIQPSRMAFSVVSNNTYFDLQPSALIDMTEDFNSDTGQFTLYSEGTPGTFSVTGGEGVITHVGADRNDIVTITSSSYSMPQAFVQIRVTSITPSNSGYDNSGVGLVKDQNNFIFASIDRLNSIGRIQIKIGGSNTFLASVTKAWTAPFTIGLSLVGNSASLWADTGSGWQHITGVDVTSQYDFRTTGNLTGWKAGFTLASGTNATWRFDTFKSGRFGAVGLRDMTMVTTEDGLPYINAGVAKFSATAVDARGNGYCGVFDLDLSSYAITQQSVIMVSRGGKTYNDLSAHIIRYPNGDRRLLIGTWGNGFGGSIQTIHQLLTTGDILTGTTVVSGLTQLNLPGLLDGNYGAYDAVMVYDTANSRWLIAYTITTTTTFAGSPFYAAAAYSTDLSSWTAIAQDTGNQGYEGTKLLKTKNGYWILAGGPAGSGNSARIYDASLTFVDTLTATFSGGVDTQPHPMVFASSNYYYLLTFDNTRFGGVVFTWGKPIVHRAAKYF